MTSEAGEPLPGANVFLQYTTYGTATDAEGVYSLRVPAAMATDQQMELVAKFIGYRTKTAKIKLSPGTTTQNFALAQDVLELEGIVVTGLGETVKEKLGVTIAQVKPELVAQVDQSNIVSALSGKVANVEITKTSGDAGTNTFIQIRGTSTIDQSNQPLFVVDGSPISNRTEYLNGANGGTESQNRASDINLEDIGSIEILKGAAASAVYGSRASNGVILVTTKSGKPGKTKISYKSSWGINKQSEFYPMQQWFGQGTGGIFRRDNSRTWGQPLNVQGAPHYNPNIPYVAVYGTDTLRQVYDHARELTGTGNSNDNNITISGGNQYTTFFLSLGRTYEKAHWKAGSDYERYTARVKASQVITEEFKLTGNIAYVNTAGNYLQRGDNLFGLAIGQLRTPPDFNNLPYIDPKTGLHRSYRYSQPTVLRRNRGHDNPFWTMYEDVNTADLDRVYGNVNFEYDPYNWLNLQYTFGSDYSLDDRTTVLPPGGTAEDGNGRVRRATYGYQELDGNLVATVWANKFLHFWNINPTFMFGHNFNRRKYHQLLSTGVNMGVAGFNQLDNAVAQEPDEYEFLVHTESYFGQLTVDFYNQLYLTGALRNEGSSTFGFSEKRHWYPKLSAAWDFTKQFTNLPLIEYGKLRAAYGEAGVQPGVYTLASGYFTGTFGVGWNPELNLIYRGIQGFRSENTLENQDVKPERTRELEFGTNLAFWNSRIGVDFTYYKEAHTQKTTSSRDSISADEIKASAATDAYDLIRSLRPHWLQGRGAKSIKYAEMAYPIVYVNGSRHGTIGSLHTITVHNITEIHFLSSGEAANRLGLNHPSGAILISMF